MIRQDVKRWFIAIAVLGISFGLPSTQRAHAVGFTDAEAYASLDMSNLYLEIFSLGDGVDPWFVEPANEYEQGVYASTFDGVSQFDIAEDSLNSGTTEWPQTHYVTANSAHPTDPVFSDAASQITSDVMYSLVGAQFDTEAYASSYRNYHSIILGDEGYMHVRVPYEISFGTAAVVPPATNVYAEVALTVHVTGNYEGQSYDYTYYDYAYFWFQQSLGSADSTSGELSRLVPYFNGLSFDLTFTTQVYAVQDDYWYPQSQWGNSLGFGTGNGGEIPEPVSCMLWGGVLPMLMSRRNRRH